MVPTLDLFSPPVRPADLSFTTAISICEVGAVGATKPERAGIVRLKSEIKQVRAGSASSTGRIDGRAEACLLLGFREFISASRSYFGLQSCPGGRTGVNLLVGLALAAQYRGSTGVLEKAWGWGHAVSQVWLVGLFHQQKLSFPPFLAAIG